MTEISKNKAKKFYYWLDPIRACAALLVLLVHARSVMFETYGNLVPESQNILTVLFYSLCGLGGVAVCLFYVLSGFLVGGKTIERSMAGTISPRRFFLDRLFRIGVPLTGALVLICIVNTVIGTGIEWKQLFGQYLGLQCVLTSDYGGVFWTLPYEIWFYALLLALILICKKSKYILIGAVIFILSLVVFCNLLPQFLYVLACGILCYFIKDYRFNRPTLTLLWALLIPAFFVYFIFHVHFVTSQFGLSELSIKVQPPSQITLFTLVALVLSQYVSRTPVSKGAIRINKAGNKIAAISYSLFLTHYQVLKVWKAYVPRIDTIDLKSMGLFICLCLICIVVAYVFYILFERNTNHIQRFIEQSLRVRR